MPCDGHDIQLLRAIEDGNMRRVEAALEAGANVNGYPEQLPYAPMVAAIIANHAGIVNFLLEQGADPDRRVIKEVACPGLGRAEKTMLGARALHIAASSGKAEIVRLLLERSRADPNATDNGGDTALMLTCKCQHVCVEVVRLLLEAGADPGLAEEEGFIPLHMVAYCDHMDLVDMLYSKAPATLSRCADKGQTPLFVACGEGHERMVSKLLSLGATEPIPRKEYPLTAAVVNGCVGVVRVMVDEGGVRAVSGDAPLAEALCMAIEVRQARILRLLLMADGERGRWQWANRNIDRRHLLHFAAGFCYPAAVSVLLEEGAHEVARDSEGCIPRDVLGVDFGQAGKPQRDRGKSPFAGCCSAAQRTELNRGRGPLTKKRMPVVTVMVTLLLLLLLLRSPGLHQQSRRSPSSVCAYSGRRRRAVQSSS
ncbi:unnamed protein product [Laminaria digitata]